MGKVVDLYWSMRNPLCWMIADKLMDLSREYEFEINPKVMYPLAERCGLNYEQMVEAIEGNEASHDEQAEQHATDLIAAGHYNIPTMVYNDEIFSARTVSIHWCGG